MEHIEKLIKYNQQHLLKFENELTESEKQALHSQIKSLDFSYLEELNKRRATSKAKTNVAETVAADMSSTY